MSAAAPSMNRHQFETLIIERAWKNPEFRQQFISDPKAMIEKYTGQKLPEAFKIVVHEEDANTMHVTIPIAPQQLSELSDDDLERVAGGTDVVMGATFMPASYQNVTLVNPPGPGVARSGW